MSDDAMAARNAANRRALLAKLVKERGLGGARSERIAPRADPGLRPLSFAQQRLWFLDRLEPGSARYNIFALFGSAGRLDREALERSLGELLRRHEALRSRIREAGGEPVLEIAAPAPVELPETDLTGESPAEREARRARLVEDEARRPFDLARGPLIRFALLKTGPEAHELCVCVHHIVADAWSIDVLARDLNALYAGFAQGATPTLPALPLQYADFAAWQRAWLTGQNLESELGYWRERLAGLETLPLATDRPRPQSQRFRGAWRSLALGSAVAAGVRELSQRQGVTPFVTLAAAFQALLSRYTGETDIPVGTPVASRTRAELEDLVGFFGNMLVLRSDLSGDPTFAELLGRVRDTTVGAYAHQDLPFEKLVEWLRPERDLSRNPLFQVAFVLQQGSGAESGAFRLRPAGVDSGVTKFDLSLYVTPTSDDLFASFEFDTDLFDAATVERMLGHYARLLAAAVVRPATRLSELPLLDDAERRTLLVDWTRTAADYPRDRCVHHAVEEQAAARPDTLAVAAADGSLSYAEIERRANVLAQRLVSLGARPETAVGVCLERSAEMVVALLAVLKTGAAYLPLDPEYPRERLSFMLEDAGAPVLVTRTALWPDAAGRHVVRVDTEDLSGHAPAPVTTVDAANLAYVIYTSGSTGRPKGVEVTHRSLANLVAWHQQAYAIGPEDRATQLAGPSFDASVWEIWPYLTAGASLHVPDDDTRSLPDRLRAYLADQAISVAFLPTPLAEAVLAGAWERPPRLRALLTGGDRLHRPTGPRPPFRLVNHYGPTENTVVATCGDVAWDARLDPPIGRALPNTRTYVLDARLRPVPVGVPGELFLAGESLARGYRGRAELTAERFVPDPFAGAPGGRLYRTGDLVRYRVDGQLDFLGRIDRQVKLRGLRIELGEIEAVLAQLPGVRECLVIDREDTPGQRRLVGYVAPAPGAVLEAAALRDALKPSLPAHMIPPAFVVLERLPLTPNGKIDRRALPAPAPAEAADGEAALPRSEVEAILARVWADVLGVGRVSIHDNFFELGGDSILSIQIVARAAAAGLSLTPRQLFQHQTVADLAAVVERGAAAAEQGPVAGELPLTPIQRWFFEQDMAAPQHFNQSVLLEPRESVTPAHVEDALRALVDHHDALRLRYEGTGATLVQVNAPAAASPRLLRADVAGLAPAEQDAALAALADEVQRSLDLGRGRLVAAAWIELGARGRRLLLVVHHLAVDGVSWRVLIEDLGALCAQLARGAAPALPQKTTSFRDWALGLAAAARRPETAADAAYWTALAPPRPLPRDHEGGRNLYGSVATVSLALTAEETQAVLRRSAGDETEINDRLLAALLLSLEPWTGSRELLVDLEGHGREDVVAGANVSRTVGWFTAMYPVSLRVERGASPARVVAEVGAQLRRVPGHGLSFGLLRYSGDPALAALLARVPAPEVSFNYLGQFDAAGAEALFRFATEGSGPNQDPDSPRGHLLDVSGLVSSQRLTVVFAYSTAVHSRRTIEGLSLRFHASLLSLLSAAPEPEDSSALELERALQQVQFE